MKLTIEEMNLLCMVDAHNRENAIKGVKELLVLAENEELQDICSQTIRKLEKMTDDEFEEYDFTAYMEEFGEE